MKYLQGLSPSGMMLYMKTTKATKTTKTTDKLTRPAQFHRGMRVQAALDSVLQPGLGRVHNVTATHVQIVWDDMPGHVMGYPFKLGSGALTKRGARTSLHAA